MLTIILWGNLIDKGTQHLKMPVSSWKIASINRQKGDFFSEIMHRDSREIILQDLHITITNQENEVLTTQKLTNYEITYDNLCFQYCTKSLCLDIKNKI